MNSELYWSSAQDGVQLNVGRKWEGGEVFWSIFLLGGEENIGESWLFDGSAGRVVDVQERLSDWGVAESRIEQVVGQLEIAFACGEEMPVLGFVDMLMPVPSEVVAS